MKKTSDDIYMQVYMYQVCDITPTYKKNNISSPVFVFATNRDFLRMYVGVTCMEIARIKQISHWP